MKVAAFFAGIGGIELGLHRAGHETVLVCDSDPHAQAVLRDRFGREPLGDVEQVGARDLPRGVSLVTAGFPCQDLSQAGGTRGIGGAKSGVVRHLFEILDQRRVPWLLIENVSFMLQLDRGGAMGYLTGELGRLGYRWAYRVLDTRAFGLPQRRERVFLLASREGEVHPARLLFGSSVEPRKDSHEYSGKACGFYWTEGTRGLGWAVDAIPTIKGGSTVGIPSPPAIWIPGGWPGYPDDVTIFTPGIEDAERLQGFEPGWTEAAARVDRRGERYRWKLVGNAVSVEVAAWIGELLSEQRENLEPRAKPLESAGAWPKAAWGQEGQRYAVSKVTTWPFEHPPEGEAAPSLRDFLESPRPLSERATRGFLSRFTNSSLREPERLVDALRQHLVAMERGLPEVPQPVEATAN